MSRITKIKKHRIKQGDKIKARKDRKGPGDHMAMLAANVGPDDWAKMPEHTRQLFRARAQMALSVFIE